MPYLHILIPTPHRFGEEWIVSLRAKIYSARIFRGARLFDFRFMAALWRYDRDFNARGTERRGVRNLISL